MDTNDFAIDDAAVVALDHKGDLIAETHHGGRSGRQAESTRKRQAEMLIFNVTVEGARWRL
ncbi:hypothetical protein D3C83_165110 [compost metagenome]